MLPLATHPPAAPAAPTDASAARSGFGAAMLRELNRVRARHHLPAVGLEQRIGRTARAHSLAIARAGLLTHGAWSQRVARAAGHPSRVGEVLGWLGPTSPTREAATLVRQWLASPAHRPVLLGGAFRRVGIGRVTGTLAGARAAIYTVDFASAR